MKKFFLLAMAAVAMTFTACKNEPAAPAQPEEPQAAEVVLIETDSIAKVIEAADSTQLSSLLTTVQEQIESLKNTDPAKAKEYLATIQNFLKENADKIKAFVGTGTVASLVDQVTKFELPDVVDAAKDIAEGAAEGAVDAAEGAVDAAKDAAAEVKDAAVDKANEAVDAAKGAVEDAKNAAADKAADAVDAAADKVKGALGK